MRSFDDLDPDLAIYRQRTIQFLRRYFKMSMEVGRVPSPARAGSVPRARDLVSYGHFRGYGHLRARHRALFGEIGSGLAVADRTNGLSGLHARRSGGDFRLHTTYADPPFPGSDRSE